MDKASTSDNSQLLRRLIEEKVNSTLDEPLSKLINESESHDVQEIIKKLDLKSMEDDILKKNRKSYPTPWSNINLNRCDYTVIIEGLNSNSTITKLKILDKLLSIQIIDTKQKLWGDLSQSLRKCFVSANNEIFIRTLKIHHRIIAFPNSSCDGYLSLLKSTFLLLNSRYFTDLNKNRILQTLQLIIDAQNIVIKFLLHANRNLIDEVVAAFVNVISFKSVFDWFGLLDPKTNWLRNFCYGTYIRNVFFSHLKEKTPDFVKHIIATFIKKSLNSDDCEVYYGYFLLHFWRYEHNLKFYPDEICIEHILELTIIKINQKKKSVLAELVVNLFAYNPSLLNQKILDVLVEPLGNISRNNIRNLVENNKHLLTIINNVAQSRNFKVLFGVCSKLRKGRSRQLTRNSTNLPQKIVDLSVILLRSHLNQNEKNTQDENVLLSMLLCCRNIYECHPIALIHVNPSKLIQNLHDFYRLSWKNNNTDMKDVILGLFKFFYSNYGAIIKILGCNNEILDDLFGFVPSDDLKMIINRIATDKYGFELLKSNYGQIVKPYLEQIWFCYENDEENDFVKFILFLFVVKLSTRATVAFLFDDEESTVVESNDKTVVLVELIEKSLNNFNCEPVEEYLGLLAMKVMMVNLDLLLYLQANHQMQEKLKSLEDSEDENVIIDAQTSLRRNILISLEMIGFPSNKCNKNILQTTDFAPIPQIFEIFEFSPNGHELKTFLENNSSNTDFSWLLQARRAFRNSLEFFDTSFLIPLLEQIPKSYVYRKTELQWPPADSVYYQLHPEDFCGISIIINFGLKTGLLNLMEGPSHNENLVLLIKQSRTLLGHQPEHFMNFDWFVGIIFLICSGNFEQCQSVLMNFTNTPTVSLVWATFAKEFDTSLQENFHQHLSVVLEENCSCFRALKMLGISPSGLVQSWLNQCFFSYLRFEEICNFLAFSVLFPPECLLYYMVAVFHQLNERICVITHSPTTENIFDMTEMSSFKLSDSMYLIEKLMKHYRNAHKL